jgi:hypothetical protein
MLQLLFQMLGIPFWVQKKFKSYVQTRTIETDAKAEAKNHEKDGTSAAVSRKLAKNLERKF